MIYAGTAAGKRRAHWKKFFPKKLYLVTTQAVETPNSVLNNPTPNIRIIVLEMYIGKTVENKWGHKEVSPKNAE